MRDPYEDARELVVSAAVGFLYLTNQAAEQDRRLPRFPVQPDDQIDGATWDDGWSARVADLLESGDYRRLGAAIRAVRRSWYVPAEPPRPRKATTPKRVNRVRVEESSPENPG